MRGDAGRVEMKTTKFDIQDHLKTRAERVAYLEAVMEDGDSSLIAAALGDIARAVGPRASPAKRA